MGDSKSDAGSESDTGLWVAIAPSASNSESEADPDADMASFGLDRPYLEVTMQIGGRDDVPEERLSLLVGKPFPGDRRLVYIKLRNNPVVSLVNSGFVEHLKNMAAATSTS